MRWYQSYTRRLAREAADWRDIEGRMDDYYGPDTRDKLLGKIPALEASLSQQKVTSAN